VRQADGAHFFKVQVDVPEGGGVAGEDEERLAIVGVLGVKRLSDGVNIEYSN
jgi:hypothetical protein